MAHNQYRWIPSTLAVAADRGGLALGEALVQLAGTARKRRPDLEHVAHQPVGRHTEDRRVRVAVDGDDNVRFLHADLVLDLAGDAAGDVQARSHGLSGLADLVLVA